MTGGLDPREFAPRVSRRGITDRKGGGFVELIAFLLFIVFTIIGVAGKGKKQGSAAAKSRQPLDGKPQANAAPARAGKPIRPVAPVSAIPKDIDDLMAEVKKWVDAPQTQAVRHSEPVVQAVDRAKARQGASMLDDPECAGGSMAHAHDEGHSALEDDECVGGSMEHTHTEGVSRVAQARHMAAIDESAHDDDMLPETIDARSLRRAVVMAEVLGKPRALRAMRN